MRTQDYTEQDIFNRTYIVRIGNTDYDVGQYDIDDLRWILKMLQEEREIIGSQIEDALYIGEYDKGWLVRVKGAHRAKGKQIDIINYLISEKKRRYKQSNPRPMSQYFLDVAREKLPRHIMDEIFEAAKLRFDADKDNEK